MKTFLSFDFSVYGGEEGSLYFLPMSDRTDGMVHGLLLLPTQGRPGTYERCGVFRMLRNFVNDASYLDEGEGKGEFELDEKAFGNDEFWIGMCKRAEARNQKRADEGLEIFDVEYSVGETNMDKKEEEQGESIEYLEFDGEDYVIRII